MRRGFRPFCGTFAALVFVGISADTRAQDIGPVAAQPTDGQDGDPQSGDAPSAVAAASATGRGQTYDPAYFNQYAPRNALDMVAQIPGFSISDDGGGRGLGQANQNVIVNGARFSSKSDSVRDQLRRIPASDVLRIEVVDGTTLDIPGLTGQVANVVVESAGMSGQFRWRTGFRAFNTSAQLFGGEASISGSSGPIDYTVAVSNENNRFGADGEIFLTDGAGQLIERQDSKFSGGFDNPKLAANFTYRPSAVVVANLNLSYNEDFFFRNEPETGFPAAGPVRSRISQTRENGPEYEIGADIQFPLGPGSMKFIGLERFERDNFSIRVVDSFADATPATGDLFERTNAIGERIGRFEYGWAMLGGDWQLSGEAAFNRLDRVSALFALDGDGVFQPVPFPSGTGGVSEDRYEAILSFSRQLTDRLAIQSTAGAEFSTIEQTGSAANARSFRRPKGSFSLAWKPSDGFDANIEVSRQVGQLSFGDFLASVALNDDNQNAGNNNLQPDQSWQVEFEANKKLGRWGSVQLELRHAWFEDFIDFFPIGAKGEARGNIGDAQRTQIEVSGLIKLDPVGWRGAQVEVRGIKRWMDVTDPFTNRQRPFSRDLVDLLDIDLRHDVPDTSWAYGVSLFTEELTPYSRRFEIGKEIEGPAFVDLFVEHKDVLGLTVNLRAANILSATQQLDRTIFAGPRPTSAVLLRETYERRIGPIFRMSVSGNF